MLDYEKIEDIDLKQKFIQDFQRRLREIKKEYKEIIFICVGTDKMTGDAFGPIVGTKLTERLTNRNFSNLNIYGTLKNNINYENIKEIQYKINEKEACIIVIDAALSKKENIGKIFVANKKTVLGKSLNKNDIELGDISIKAVVAKDYKISNYNLKILQTISLNTIIRLADVVTEGIEEVIKTL